MAESFQSNYATANGIAQAGSPLGLIVVAPLMQLFLDTYGWRAVFLLMGGISLHLVVLGALLRQPSLKNKEHADSYHSVSSREQGIDDELDEKSQQSTTVNKTSTSANGWIGFSVCFQLSFWLPTTIYVCLNLTDTFWCILRRSRCDERFHIN